jgi:hypothetical protein
LRVPSKGSKMSKTNRASHQSFVIIIIIIIIVIILNTGRVSLNVQLVGYLYRESEVLSLIWVQVRFWYLRGCVV